MKGIRWAAVGLLLVACVLVGGAGWRGMRAREKMYIEAQPVWPAVRQVATPPPTSVDVVQLKAPTPVETVGGVIHQVAHEQTIAKPAEAGNAEAAAKPAANKPEVDSAAVRRRGDFVEHTTDIMAEADENLMAALANVPDDDNGKWHISVVTMTGCAPCAQLKAAWRADPHLLAWANPNDAKSSWAHFREYDKDDKSQEFRFIHLRFRAFPTVILQPPRNGQYGDPSVIVYGDPYPGSPKKLASEMRAAMKLYIEKQPKRERQTMNIGHAADATGSDPPYKVPANDPVGPYVPAVVDTPSMDTPAATPGGGGMSVWMGLLIAGLSQLTHLLPFAWRTIVAALIASVQSAALAAQAKSAPKE